MGGCLRVALQEDWAVDSGGAKHLGTDAFRTSIFELADIWTLTVHAEEYIEFLEKLLMTVSDGEHWRSVDGMCAFVRSDIRALLGGGEPARLGCCVLVRCDAAQRWDSWIETNPSPVATRT